MASPVGIDLGTTFSSIAVYENGQGNIIGDRRGKKLIPSIVYVCPKTGKYFVGETAYELSAMCPRNLLKDSKRLLGRRYDDEAVRLIVDSKETSYWLVRDADDMVAYEVEVRGSPVRIKPEEVSGEVLRYLKASAEEYFNGETVAEAVISVPAYFSNAQRKATVAAAASAGLNVLRLITEPVAAALHYIKNRNVKKRNVKKRNVKSKSMVFDWGGGTLDVSFIDVHDRAIEVKAVYGDSRLGGRDLDEVLFKRFYINVTRQPRKFIRRLLGSCVKLKEHLSVTDEFTTVLELYDGVDDMEMRLTRKEFIEMNGSIFERLSDIVNYALHDIGLNPDDISDVVLVGGSTRIPKVKEILENVFGKSKFRTDLNPDEAVAMGACIQAAAHKRTGQFRELEKYTISEVTPLSIGLLSYGDLMDTFIPKNSKLPRTETKVFQTTKNDQDIILFTVFEGERKNTNYNNRLGSFTITDLPKGRAGHVKFNVTLSLNEDGILTVSASETSTGKTNKLVVTMSEFRLSERQLKLKLDDAKTAKREDELFESFIERRNVLIQRCRHVLYDSNKISDKGSRDKVEENCRNFISSAESLSFLEMDRLEAMFVSFWDETHLYVT